MDTRIGIVGCGRMGRAHADVLSSVPGLDFVGVCDSDETAANALADHAGVSARPLDSLAKELDVAIVATPPASHVEVVHDLLDRGVGVFCEKPLCLGTEDAEGLFEFARERSRFLAVATKFRFVRSVQTARDLMRDGTLGAPLAARVVFGGLNDVTGTWFEDPEVSGGGVVADNGPHAFDLLTFLGLAPRTLTAVSGGGTPGVESHAFLQGESEQDALWSVRLSWASDPAHEDFAVIEGDKATLRLGWSNARMKCHSDREWTTVGDGYDKHGALSGNLAAVRDACRGEPTVLPTEAETLKVVRLAEQARVSLAPR